MKMRVALTMVIASLLWRPTLGKDIEKIVFEVGSVGPSGAPAASGWQYISTNTNPDPTLDAATAIIENVPNRTFLTGSNSEALVLHPWYFNNDASFGHGVEWSPANDASGATVETIDAGEIVYLQMEIFSDFAGGGQYWKAASAVGFRGNGTNPSVNRGFNDEAALGDNDKNLVTSIEADWTWDTVLNYNGIVKNSDKAEKHDNTRYSNPPTTADLDKSYISTAIFRQGVDASVPFIGTETEINEVLDSQNGGESSATGTSAPTEPWGGNTNVITGMVVDRAQVNLLRGSSNPFGTVTRVNAHSSFIDPTDAFDDTSPTYIGNAVLGVKMFRFGITQKTDVNLDGVTDGNDQAIVIANQGKWPNADAKGATHFEGDIDNDLDVDADDLAFFTVVDPCDLNRDGAVDAADAGIMFGDWGGPGSTSIADKNQDGFVDAADAGVMFEAWTGDPSTPGDKSATAEYNAATGELKISSAGAVNVFVQSASNAITPVNPAPAVPVGLLTNNTGRVGITNLGPIEVTNFSFGNIGKGLAMSDLKLVYTTALGTKGIEVAASTADGAAFRYIPEPTSWTLLGLSLVSFLAGRRRVTC